MQNAFVGLFSLCKQNGWPVLRAMVAAGQQSLNKDLIDVVTQYVQYELGTG